MSMANVEHKKATQLYLDIAQIRDDLVVLNDGTLRAVLLVSSLNFALKSEEEQKATIQAYVAFLNALEHQLHIVIQSRPLSIDPYLKDLENLEREQTNELLRMQTKDYRNFVRELVKLAEIMTKRFYVIVPYDPSGGARKARGFLARAATVLNPARSVRLSEDEFAKAHRELGERVDHILTGLAGIGLRSVQLSTQHLIELFYATYNPDLARVEALPEVGELKVEA